MKNRHMGAFSLMLMRRRRLDKKLNDTLAARRGEHAALHRQAGQKKTEVDEQTAQLDHQDKRIAALTSGTTSFRVREFNDCRLYREVIVERRSSLEQEWQRACALVTQKEREINETRAQILANQSHIEAYEKRVTDLRRLAERSADDAQDEETEESRRSGPPGGRGDRSPSARRGERR